MAQQSRDSNGFFNEITAAVKIIREHSAKRNFIRIVSHVDADGLSAASILCRALRSLEVPFRIRIEKQFDEALVADLALEDDSLIIFADLGSGNLDLIKTKLSANEIIVLDHHQPINVDSTIPRLCHVNPHLYGFDGSREISAAGVTYLVAKALDGSNIDLASLAVVGALGDAQDLTEKRTLVGLNNDIVKDAIDSGYLSAETDLIFYGRETRPIYKAIAYTTNPYIPGLSGEEDECYGFLVNLGINLKENDRWRAINDLSVEDKQKIYSEIAKHLSNRGSPNGVDLDLIGTVYTMVREERWTPLRDAREYASLLNACGKMKKNGLGVAVGFGNRGEMLDEAQLLFADYKKTLSRHIDWLSKNPGRVQRLENINVIDGSGVIDELMISTIASILSSNNFCDNGKPVIAITMTEDKTVKASGRVSDVHRYEGLNLGILFQEAASRFSGRGGGHVAAAGAQLPKGIEAEFIKLIDQQVASCCSVGSVQ